MNVGCMLEPDGPADALDRLEIVLAGRLNRRVAKKVLHDLEGGNIAPLVIGCGRFDR